eukprot:TRINITY_DN1877_c0_g1_i2.p1 TRINITY_DN1877_c0_g1~~TRINITY_DN1877_c0_g1_i2.p1  ORF type:complete len:612 (+),score=109.87 TRINITY_DN1877_c0_g1_i2:74-1909(+)
MDRTYLDPLTSAAPIENVTNNAKNCQSISNIPFFGFKPDTTTPLSAASLFEMGSLLLLLIFLIASYSCFRVKKSGRIVSFARRYTIIPIYYTFLKFYLLNALLLVLYGVLCYFVKDPYVVHFCGGLCLTARYSVQESVALFMLQQSGGKRHLNRTVRLALLWGIVVGASWTIEGFALAHNSCVGCKQYFWLVLNTILLLFYSWVLLSAKFKRLACGLIEPRPAIYAYALFIVLVSFLWDLASIISIAQIRSVYPWLCMSTFGNALYYLCIGFVVYFTFYKDSNHWRTALKDGDRNPYNYMPKSGGTLNTAADEVTSLLRDYDEDRLRVIDFTRLKVKKKIASGSTASIYRGVLDTSKEVAVKQFHLEILEKSTIKQYIDEAITMSSLGHHENIVEYFGIVVEPPDIRLVIEICENGSLFNILHVKKMQLSWNLKLKLAVDCARGLYFLHSKGIIHRDIKSLNFLINKNWTAKLADFGQARKLTLSTTMTHNRGTIHWMAPEVLSKKRYSTSADIYSFAIVLYELYTQDVPFEEEPIVDLLNAIASGSKRPPIPEDCPRDYARLMEECWTQEPEVRPDSKRVVTCLENMFREVLKTAGSDAFIPGTDIAYKV